MALDRTIGNTDKPVDDNHVQLFHRVNAPRFSKTRAPANGRGFECGCKSVKSDFLASGISNVLGRHLVKALSTLTDVALAAIPGIGPALVAFKQIATKIAEEEGFDFEAELGKLISQEVEGALFAQFLRSLPAWVPVDRKGNKGAFGNPEGREVEMEVEGILTRSFQTCHDIPFFQWNRWYNWTFQVSPIDGYGYMAGLGNLMTPREQKELLSGRQLGHNHATDVYLENRENGGILHSMECLMDFGSFCKHPTEGAQVTGVMYHPGWPFWPMSGDYFWGVGRWVYHCQHPSNDDKTGDNPGLMPTQLRPMKAFACSRYEGFKFDENEKHVPAVRFLFFSSRLGGYLDFHDKGESEGPTTCGIAYNDTDYEFILDLPDAPPSATVWPIGHTPVFPANTLVLRPSLLMKLEFAPFGVPASGAFLGDSVQFETSIKPKVEVVAPDKPNDPPRQVKVTIPMSQIPKGKNAYGVCINLGWFDPDGVLAKRVKKVRLASGPLRILDDDKDDGFFRFHFCFNGRWFFAPFTDPDVNTPVSLTGVDARFTQFVPDDSRAKLTSHGMLRHGFGEYIETQNRPERTVRVGGLFRAGQVGVLLAQGGKVLVDQFGNEIESEFVKELLKEGLDLLEGERRDVDWKTHVDQDNKAVASAVAREMFVEKVPLFNDMNEPLALIEPTRDNSNPVIMKTIADDLARTRRVVVRATQFEKVTDVIGEADKLAVRLDPDQGDYEIDLAWTVEEQ
jgi:hypothetical protein